MKAEDVAALEALRGTADCPSDYALDRLVGAELDAAAAASLRNHAAGCVSCGARLADLEAAQAEMARTDPSETGERPTIAFPARGAPPVGSLAARRRRIQIGASLLAVAASLALVLWPQGPDTLGTRRKGGLALELVARHADGSVEDVLPDAVLHPDEAIRFRISLEARGYIGVLGLDARGQVTAYWPDAATMRSVAAGNDRLLDGSIVLDATLGAERIFAVACDEPAPLRRLVTLGRRALGRAHGDPARLTRLGSGCDETSFLIRKEPSP